MNKLNALNAGALPEIICGRTEVIVKKRETNETGREQIKTVHKGIILQKTTGNFVRVYNPLPTKAGGDTAPEHAEWFPLDARSCWCEITAVRDEERAMPIPALLRY